MRKIPRLPLLPASLESGFAQQIRWMPFSAGIGGQGRKRGWRGPERSDYPGPVFARLGLDGRGTQCPTSNKVSRRLSLFLARGSKPVGRDALRLGSRELT